MRAGCLRTSTSIVFVLILLTGSMSAANQKGKNAGTDNGKTHVDAQVAVDIFLGRDREVIHEYYVAHPGGLPPGLAKRNGNLRPGLEKQLRRKGHLPPGLEKKLVPFPVEVERRLPPLKPGLVRGVIEGRAVIYNPKTSVILDVFVVL
jgi:hypothetical protein